MGTRRLGCALAGLVVLCSLASGCSSSRPASGGNASPTSEASSLVALGDSVPRGTNCRCAPYPPLTAEGLTASAGRTVTATNDAIAGATTATVLRQLESDDAVIGDVRQADVIEIEIGANDVGYHKQIAAAAEAVIEKTLHIGRRVEAARFLRGV